MTKIDDLEAIEVFVILASDLCFTLLVVCSNPGRGIVFFIINQLSCRSEFTFSTARLFQFDNFKNVSIYWNGHFVGY